MALQDSENLFCKMSRVSEMFSPYFCAPQTSCSPDNYATALRYFSSLEYTHLLRRTTCETQTQNKRAELFDECQILFPVTLTCLSQSEGTKKMDLSIKDILGSAWRTCLLVKEKKVERIPTKKVPASPRLSNKSLAVKATSESRVSARKIFA